MRRKREKLSFLLLESQQSFVRAPPLKLYLNFLPPKNPIFTYGLHCGFELQHMQFESSLFICLYMVSPGELAGADVSRDARERPSIQTHQHAGDYSFEGLQSLLL